MALFPATVCYAPSMALSIFPFSPATALSAQCFPPIAGNRNCYAYLMLSQVLAHFAYT